MQRTRSKSHENSTKSTNAIDIPPLMTAWSQVRALPGHQPSLAKRVPIATALVAPACTTAPAPIAVPFAPATVALCPTATALATVALAELPSAVAEETFGVHVAQVAFEKSPNAAPPLEADAVLPMAIEPVASTPVPIAMKLTPVACAPNPRAMALVACAPLPMAIALVSPANVASVPPGAALPPMAIELVPNACVFAPSAVERSRWRCCRRRTRSRPYRHRPPRVAPCPRTVLSAAPTSESLAAPSS
jgi:hypothetical protein